MHGLYGVHTNGSLLTSRARNHLHDPGHAVYSGGGRLGKTAERRLFTAVHRLGPVRGRQPHRFADCGGASRPSRIPVRTARFARPPYGLSDRRHDALFPGDRAHPARDGGVRFIRQPDHRGRALAHRPERTHGAAKGAEPDPGLNRFDRHHPAGAIELGVLLALGSGVAFAFYLIATRQAAQTSDPIKTLAFQCVVGTALLTPQALLAWSIPAWNDALLFLAMGLFSAMSHSLSILAFRFADASTLAPLVYVELVGAALIGYFVFGEIPSFSTLVGAGLIIGSGLILLERRARLSQAMGDR